MGTWVWGEIFEPHAGVSQSCALPFGRSRWLQGIWFIADPKKRLKYCMAYQLTRGNLSQLFTRSHCAPRWNVRFSLLAVARGHMDRAPLHMAQQPFVPSTDFYVITELVPCITSPS